MFGQTCIRTVNITGTDEPIFLIAPEWENWINYDSNTLVELIG